VIKQPGKPVSTEEQVSAAVSAQLVSPMLLQPFICSIVILWPARIRARGSVTSANVRCGGDRARAAIIARHLLALWSASIKTWRTALISFLGAGAAARRNRIDHQHIR